MKILKKKLINSESGFTLIELLLVIVIISIIGLMSASFYARFLTQNSVANATDQLVNQLRKAQLNSMMSKRASGWGLNYSSNTITLFKGTALGQDNAFNESFSVNSNITISGLSTLTFAKFTGAPSVTPTITISGQNTTRTITVTSTGIVSVN